MQKFKNNKKKLVLAVLENSEEFSWPIKNFLKKIASNYKALFELIDLENALKRNKLTPYHALSFDRDESTYPLSIMFFSLCIR